MCFCLRRPWTWPTDFRSISLFYCFSFFFLLFSINRYTLIMYVHLICTHTHQVRLQLLVVNFKLPTTSTSSTTVMSAALLTLSRPPHIYALCLCVWVCVCVLCAWWNRHLFKKSFIFVACAFLLFCNAKCLLCFMPTFISLFAFIAIFRVFASWPVWLTLTKCDTAATAVFCQFLYSLSHKHTHTHAFLTSINSYF